MPLVVVSEAAGTIQPFVPLYRGVRVFEMIDPRVHFALRETCGRNPSQAERQQARKGAS